MKILILHLSDIHFETGHNRVLEKIPRLADAVQAEQTQASDISACLVCVTGDVAHSGHVSEYQIAKTFLSNLRTRLEALPGIEWVKLAVAPGNHDCDFRRDSSARQLLLSSVASNLNSVVTSDTSIVDVCTSVQADFFTFLGDIVPDSDNLTGSLRLHYGWTFLLGEKQVRVLSHNTAWLSQKIERQGQLLFPTAFLTDANGQYDLVISLFHHPYNWLEATNAREFRQCMERSADLVLTGHEHESEFYSKRTTESEVQNYIEGAVLQETGPRSGFNIVVMDLTSQRWLAVEYQWKDHDKFYERVRVPEWQPFDRNRRRLRADFRTNPTFQSLLGDPGATFTHPRVRNLTLSDIFVYPDVTHRDIKGQTETIIHGESLLARAFKFPRLLITGPSQSGKTALARRLYVDFLARGAIPLLLAGAALKSPSDAELVEVVERAVSEQYSGLMWERFRQVATSDRVVLVDGFDRCSLNRKGRTKVLSWLTHFFGRAILFSDDGFVFEEMAAPASEQLFLDWEHWSLRELGHVRRSELIERWCSLGREFTADERQLAFDISELKRRIDTLLGNRLLPSYPIFVLGILQQLEAGTAPSTFSGAYGYIYEALLTRALSSTALVSPLDVTYAYLAYVGYQMFQLQSQTIESDDLIRITDQYRSEYKVSIGLDELLKELERVGVFSARQGCYAFRYPYLYYYFVAKYMQENAASDPRVRADVMRLPQLLYTEEAANIVVFFIYLAKDQEVITDIVTRAHAMLEGTEVFDMNVHVRFLVEKRRDVLELKYQEALGGVGRQEALRHMDELEEWAGSKAREPAEVRADEQRPTESAGDDPRLKSLLALNAAFKTMYVMGQILRNFPGSLRGEVKRRVAQESYELGMRSLRLLFEQLEANIGAFTEMITARLREQERGEEEGGKEEGGKEEGGKEEASARSQSEDIAFGMALGLAHGVLRTISNSIGSRQLRETYREVFSGLAGPAPALMDLTIKLDHLGPIREKEVLEVNRIVSGNMFAETLLRGLVLEYMYSYPCSVRVRQKIFAKLGVRIAKEGERRMLEIRDKFV